ncbi:hypothetical protein X777_04489, partial [Ooceraea biroi]
HYSSREWSLPVPLHKSLDLSLLTHRDPFVAHCCPQGVPTDPTGQHRKEPAYWDGASIILKVFTGSIDLSKWLAVTRFTVHFTVFGRCAKACFFSFFPPTGRVSPLQS